MRDDCPAEVRSIQPSSFTRPLSVSANVFSECSRELNWNRARGGNYSRITFVSIFLKEFLNEIVLVRTFPISRFTILCRG